MKYLRYIFDDWLTRAAGIIFFLIVALVVFDVFTNLPDKWPFLGLMNFAMVPVLFVLGGVIFVLAILREMR